METKKDSSAGLIKLILFVSLLAFAVLCVYWSTKILLPNLNLNVKKEKAVQVKATPTVVPTAAKKENMELIIEDLKVGTGLEAVSGKKVVVNYVGTLTDGTKFDSSYDRNASFTFTLGAGEVIEGWDKGVVGMKIGGKRKLTIPANLGYGNQAVGTIPANSTLIFEIELLKIE